MQANANVPPHDDGTVSEIDELATQVTNSSAPQALKDKTLKMVTRLKRMARYGSYSGEYELIEKYVHWVGDIPWGKYTSDNLDLNHVKQTLDSNHYGLEGIKERILEYLAVAKLQGGLVQATEEASSTDEMKRLQGSSSHAPILCFIGIQGIGKTSMAKSIANALGRQFVRISLGAMGNVVEIKGQSRAYLDAEPGQVIKSLVRTKVMNPLILLDEVDKVSTSGGKSADVNAALLEILDPEQNSTFSDSYIDYPVDLSHVMFIATANNIGTLTTALLDRLEIIRFSSYTDDEKQVIAKNYLLPKVMKATGITSEQLQFDDDIWPIIIRPLGFDAGIRQLERNITTLCRKVAKMIVEGKGNSFRITQENFREFIPEDIGVYS